MESQNWLEYIKQAFEGSVSEGNYVEAKSIIEMVRIEGFEAEAKQLHNQLMEATLGDFLVESPLQ